MISYHVVKTNMSLKPYVVFANLGYKLNLYDNNILYLCCLVNMARLIIKI